MLRIAPYVGVVRAIALGAAVCLVAVACASGAPVQARSASKQAVPAAPKVVVLSTAVVTESAGVTQTAVGVPLPPHGKLGTASNRVVCPSPDRCVASFGASGGLLVLSRHGREWTRAAVPKGVLLNSLACPSAASCVGTARGRGETPYVVTQSGRTWRKSVVELPGSLDPTKTFPVLPAASCGSPGNCSAVGSYETFKPGEVATHALLVDEEAGVWGAAFDAQLPPDAATAPDVNGQGPGGRAALVSCPSAGNCVVIGTYDVLAGDLNESAGWVATERAGHWGPAAKVRLPGNPGAVESLSFTGLSCVSVGNCTAVGGSTANSGEQGLILKERNGVWLQAIRAPLPRGGVAPSEPNAFDDPLFSVACADANDCAAIGAYVKKGHHGYPGTFRGWLLAERHGAWSASAIVLPRPASAGMVFLNQVSCLSRGNCVAVGNYNGHPGHGVIAVERHGTWQRALNATLPVDAAKPSSRQTAGLDSVSCASASRCTIVGTYADKAGKIRGLILDLRIR